MKKFYTLKYEIAFIKTIIDDEKLCKYFLSNILEEKIENVKILNARLIADKINNRRQTVDILLKIDNKIINIELNTSYNTNVKKRNIFYLCNVATHSIRKGKNFININEILQININFGVNKKDSDYEYILYDKKKNKEYIKLLKIKEINIDYYKKKMYNNNKLTTKDKILAMLDLELNELKILGKGDKMIEKAIKNLEKVNEDDMCVELMSEEEELRMWKNTYLLEGEMKGEKKGIKKIAKNMIEKSFSIQDIIDTTGLTKEEIMRLN